MANYNSWEEDADLSRQTQQMNLGNSGNSGNSGRGGAAGRGGRGGFQASVPSFTPGAAAFNPGQPYGATFVPQQQQQQQQYGNQQYYGGYQNQYGQQPTYGQYGQQQGYGNVYGGNAGYQGGYNNQSSNYQQYNQRGGYQAPAAPAAAPAASASASASTPAAAPAAGNIGNKVLSIGGDAKPKVLSIGGDAKAKVLSIGGDAKPKVLSIGGDAKPKVLSIGGDEKKEAGAAAPTAAKEDAGAAAGAKVAAAKAIEKTAATPGASSAASSGRSSPSGPAAAAKAARDADAVEKEQSADVDDETLKEIYGKEHVNVIFIGHVDAGKSTLGGSILYATGMVDQRTMDKYKREAKEMGRETWYLSWALDLTSEERSKGKTVEVGRGYFETEKRRYSILDAPGHKTYVPHMIGGASQADVGVLVISARKGEYETGFEKGGQTREHAMLAKTQGVNKLIVVINKMDDTTVNWSEERYKECTTKLQQFLKGTGYNLKTDVTFMPIAAQTTMNIKDRLPKGVADWYNGPSLLEHLDNMKALDRKLNAPFMMPVNAKYRDMGTMIEGKIEAGVLKKDMSLIMMPNKQKVDLSALYGETEDEIAIAQCGDQVRLRLRGIEEEEVMPGFVLCSPKRLVHTVTAFEAQVRILDLKSILTAGYNCVLHVHSAIEEVTFAALLHKLQKGTNRKSKVPPTHARKGDSIIARLQVIGGAGAVCVERFEDYAQMGRFTLRDQGQTIAIGKIIKLITDA